MITLITNKQNLSQLFTLSQIIISLFRQLTLSNNIRVVSPTVAWSEPDHSVGVLGLEDQFLS